MTTRDIYIPYDPLPVFQPFHKATTIEAALIGGYGSGKSRALVAEALKMGLAYPGSEHLIARKTIPSLRDTTESDFIEQIPKELWDQCEKVKGGGHYQYIILPNGTKYYFKGLDDWRKIKSLNLMGVWIDEADEIDEDTYNGLTSRLRQVEPRPSAKAQGAGVIPFRVIRLACNPAGRNWIWRRFVKEGGRERPAFISSSLDNPYNPIAYVEHLMSFPEQWVRRYVFCSFDDFEGSIYPEWDWKTHVVKPYSAYDPRGFFWMGMDPGTQNPTAGVWAYWDAQAVGWWGQGRLIIVGEYSQSGVSASHHVEAWRAIEAHGTHNLSRQAGRMRVRRRIADPSIATRDRGSMMSLESQYLREGFHFEHGPRQIPERLPMLGQLIHTGKVAVTEEAMQTYDAILSYRYEDLTPDQKLRGVEAKPNKAGVDLVDAAQYIASRWIPDPVKPKPIEPDPRETELAPFTQDATRELQERGIILTDDWRYQNAQLVADVHRKVHTRRDIRSDPSRGVA